MVKRYSANNNEVLVLRIVVLLGLSLALSLVLLVFVQWKEDPLFWRNEGGYPVWLRELVFDTFYPLLLVQLLVMAVATICPFCVLPLERAFRLGVLMAVLVLWLVLGVVLVILLWNNLDNLLHGRDLHYHPQSIH